MKVTQVNNATEQDVIYMREDLISIFNDVSESLTKTEIDAKRNMEIHEQSINADFDGLKRHENEKHYKKWNKRAIIAGAISIAGVVGLVAAGAITQNPTFFSPGNLIVGGLMPALAVGVTNYFAAFSPKHRERLEKIEQERQTHLDNIPFSKQALHDQKEIEVNKAWMDAVANELGLNEVNPKALEAYAQRKLKEEKTQSL